VVVGSWYVLQVDYKLNYLVRLDLGRHGKVRCSHIRIWQEAAFTIIGPPPGPRPWR
jgi:hypothetical protein